jgi:hypothetical protein
MSIGYGQNVGAVPLKNLVRPWKSKIGVNGGKILEHDFADRPIGWLLEQLHRRHESDEAVGLHNGEAGVALLANDTDRVFHGGRGMNGPWCGIHEIRDTSGEIACAHWDVAYAHQ